MEYSLIATTDWKNSFGAQACQLQKKVQIFGILGGLCGMSAEKKSYRQSRALKLEDDLFQHVWEILGLET